MAKIWLGDFRLKQLQHYHNRVADVSIAEYSYLINDYASFYWFKDEAVTLISQLGLSGSDVIISLGFNDCVYSCTWPTAFNITTIANNYVKIINELIGQQSSVNFYICSVAPVNADYPFAPYENGGIIPVKKLNAAIEKFNKVLEQTDTFTYVNTHKYLTSTGFDTRDGTRFTFDMCSSLNNYITGHIKTQAGVSAAGFITRDTMDKAPAVPNSTSDDDSYLLWKSVNWVSPGGERGLNQCIEIPIGSGSGWCIPNCTGYAWGRFMEILGETPKLSLNNAERWYGNTSDGYERGQTPRPGAVMCWRKGAANDGDDGAGHVAIVEIVNPDGSVVFSESNYRNELYDEDRHFNVGIRSNANGRWGLGTAYTFQGFIYNPAVDGNSAYIRPSESSGNVKKSDVISNDRYLSQSEMEINAQYIWNYLGSLPDNWTINAVAGILGNMEAESTINPGLGEKGHSQSGFGLVQWTPKSNLTNWTRSRGYADSDIDGQLARIVYEKDNNLQYIKRYYKYKFSDFYKSTDDPYTLACAFAFDYERSGVVIWGFHTKGYNPCSIGTNNPSKCRTACVNSRTCYANKFGEAAAVAQAEVNRENLRKKRGGNAEKWFKFLAPHAPGTVFENKFMVNNLKIDKVTPTTVKASFIVNNGKSASYKLKKKSDKAPKAVAVVLTDESPVQIASFEQKNLIPNTAYEISIEAVGNTGEDKQTLTLEFTTPQDYPNSVKDISLSCEDAIKTPDSYFKLSVTKPDYLGYWGKSSGGYDKQLIVNGKCVKTKSISSIKNISADKFNIKSEFGYQCKEGDNIQIGIRVWVMDNNAHKIYDNQAAITSKSICLLNATTLTYLKRK